jgi:hypothetical protein
MNWKKPLMTRYFHANTEALKYPIASGALGGFSGFLHESFRQHDYLLGQRNAQAFLRWNFALPETNVLFADFKARTDQWYVRNADGVTGSKARCLNDRIFSSFKSPQGR